MKLILALLAFFSIACNDDTEPQERVQKLRAIGVGSSPLVAVPSVAGQVASVSLSFFVVAPLGETVSFENYKDEAGRYAIVTDVSLDAATQTSTAYAKFAVHSIKGSVNLPTAEEATRTVTKVTLDDPDASRALDDDEGEKIALNATLGVVPLARIRYGVIARAGRETEKIVGNIPVYAPTPELPTYQNLKINLTTPQANSAFGAKGRIALDLENPNDEKVRIGWFVSSGKVKNRRARDTEWSEVDGGAQTIIATARGMRSGAFEYQVVDVNP